MENRTLRRSSQAGKSFITCEERFERKKISTTTKAQQNEMDGIKSLYDKSYSLVEKNETTGGPAKKEEGNSKKFSDVVKKNLPKLRKQYLRRLSQADISSCSDEYRTILDDLQDNETKNNHVTSKVSKQGKKSLIRGARKISCTPDFARGGPKKPSLSTFHSPIKEVSFKLDPTSRSRIFTLPAVKDSVKTKSLSMKPTWTTKNTNHQVYGSSGRQKPREKKTYVTFLPFETRTSLRK